MQEYNLNWFGMLTINNIEQVVGLLKQLIDGKRYTFVACNELDGFKPEVRTSQCVEHNKATSKNAFNIYYDTENSRYAGFNIVDSYGVWGCSTNTTDEKFDHERKNPYFSFKYNQVIIEHRAAGGNLLYWCIAVEDAE